MLEKAMAPHSSTLAWKIPWMEEPGGLQSMGSRRVRHDWATSLSLFTFTHWRRKRQPTPVFLPGASQGRRSLAGCRLWGRTESDTTEATSQQEQQQRSMRVSWITPRSVTESLLPSFCFEFSDFLKPLGKKGSRGESAVDVSLRKLRYSWVSGLMGRSNYERQYPVSLKMMSFPSLVLQFSRLRILKDM